MHPQPHQSTEGLSDDELTLREISTYFGRLRFLIRYCTLRYIQGLKRYCQWMVLLALLITLMGGYFYLFPATNYEARASYSYTTLQKKVYGTMADKLNNLVLAGSYDQLAVVLGLPEHTVQAISKIKAVNIYNSLLSEDMAENKNQQVFYVEIAATNNTIFQIIGGALEDYFNNNRALKDITKRHLAEMKAGIQYRGAERQMVDSLIRAFTLSLTQSAIPDYGEAISTATPTSTSTARSRYAVPARTATGRMAGLMGGAAFATASIDAVALLNKHEQLSEQLTDMALYIKDHRAVKLTDDFLVSKHLPRTSWLKMLLIALAGFALGSIVILAIMPLLKREQNAA